MKAVRIKSIMIYTIILVLFLGGFSSFGRKNVVAQESSLILSDDLLTALEPGGPTLFDRILVEQNSAWADFQQEVHGEMWSAGVTFHETAFGPELGTGVNPAVLLVIYGVERNWELPANGDLRSEVERIRAVLFQHRSDWVHRQVDPNQYPVANGATYVLYRYFNGDLSKLGDWQSSFETIFGVSPNQTTAQASSLATTSSNVVAPFLQRPFDQLAYPFRHITSFFDHHYPIYTDEGDRTDMYRFDGYNFTGIPSPDNCGYGGDTGSGNYCYSGHPAYDYSIMEGTDVKAAASGHIIACSSQLGALFIEHENGLITSYLHMDPLNIPGEILCSEVDAEKPYVEQGQTIGYVSDKGSPGSVHLHFGVGYGTDIGERQNIDPFGWWGDEPDPWESYDGTLFDGLPSQWLWLGDEVEDGYLTVDNTETQAQLFNPPSSGSDWNHLNAGYQNDSWWSYLTHYATLPPDPSSKTSSIYWGVWGVNIEQPGTYKVQAYWPADPNPAADPVPTQKATYSLYYHDTQGDVQSVTLYADQSRDTDQFTTLCTVPYDNDPNGCPQYPEIQFGSGSSVLILRDATTDTIQSGKYMVFFDAVRWQEVIPPTPTPTVVPGPRGYYPNSIHVAYYNDEPPVDPITLDAPINWDTFTALVTEENVQTIDYNWMTTPPAPGVNGVFWSARYEGQLSAPQNGAYTFYLDRLDDGGRLFIDGTALIDKWLVQGPHFYSASVPLTSGIHEIKIEYAQGPGTEGSLSVAWELPNVFAKEIIGPASPGTITPVPTDTPVPPTDTPTPIPTDTPVPLPVCSKCALIRILQELAGGCVAQGDSVSGLPAIQSLIYTVSEQISGFDINVFYRVRDELLSQSLQGQHYIDLYETFSPEIAETVVGHPQLFDEAVEVIQRWEPHLRALVDGNGGSVIITSEDVQSVQSFLNNLVSYSSPELQDAIETESLSTPLEDMVGLTMDEAWVYLNGFPSAPVLDDFNRANGGIGSNWSGNTSGYNIASSQLSVDYSGSNSDIYWSNEPFGADQEAYVTLTDVDAGAWEHDLLLKAQSNNTWGDGVLEVLYDPSNQRVQVWTYEWPAGWVQHGADIPVTFVDGDQFGARTLADGTVEVYRNGELLATRDITSWSHYADGGYIGLWFIGAEDAVLDDFGGGTISGGMQSMSMGGTLETQSAETSLTPEQSNMTLIDTDLFWQGVPIGSNQKAYVTFAQLKEDVNARTKPQSNGAWGEGVVQVLYDVVSRRIQVWMYDAQKGWVKYGADIPVKFAEGNTFSVRVLANGMVEIQRNGKSLAKRDVTP